MHPAAVRESAPETGAATPTDARRAIGSALLGALLGLPDDPLRDLHHKVRHLQASPGRAGPKGPESVLSRLWRRSAQTKLLMETVHCFAACHHRHRRTGTGVCENPQMFLFILNHYFER